MYTVPKSKLNILLFGNGICCLFASAYALAVYTIYKKDFCKWYSLEHNFGHGSQFSAFNFYLLTMLGLYTDARQQRQFMQFPAISLPPSEFIANFSHSQRFAQNCCFVCGRGREEEEMKDNY